MTTKQYRTKEFKPVTLRQKIFEKFWLGTMFYNRAYGYFGTFSGIIEKVILVTVWLKLYGFYDKTAVIFWTASIISFMMIAGYLDYKYQIINEERSFNNRFDPEMQKIVQRENQFEDLKKWMLKTFKLK